MRFKILYIALLATICSCSKESFQPNQYYNYPQKEITIDTEDIDDQSVSPDAASYYENLAFMAKWYAGHPSLMIMPIPSKPSDPVNTVLQKLKSMVLIDSIGNQISIFDLKGGELQQFLNNWKEVEAYGLSQKLKKDMTRQSVELIKNRNIAFNTAIGNMKSANLDNEDPFFKVKAIMDEQEKNAIETQSSLPALKSSGFTDDNFWATVVSNFRLSYSIIQIAPNSLTPQSFVDHLRANIEPGRIIISLPGGWTTNSLLVLYPNKTWYDVGHVAIVTKNQEEIPDSIDDKFNLTIGTGVKGTIREEIGHSWCVKHGLAFMGQVCQVKWRIYINEKRQWKWKKVITDIDNDIVANEAVKYLGVPYCGTLEVFISKWTAPKSFICSSLAWYCVRETTGINISDWWSTSVYPRDVYFSENIRILDDTLD